MSHLLPAAIRRRVAPARDHAVERAVRSSNARLGIGLLYHSIAPLSGDPARELVAPHGARLFESQVQFLRERYRVVSAADLPDAAAGRGARQKVPVAITFDDDLRSHTQIAAPVLLRETVPATFFLCGASLDRPTSFWWERLQRAHDAGVRGVAEVAGVSSSHEFSLHELGEAFEAMPPRKRDHASERLLELAGPDSPETGIAAEDVRRLAEAGFEIGFHTLRHDRLTDLDDDGLQFALTRGRDRLETAAGREVTLIAYPHGRADGRVAAAARSACYRRGYTDRPEAVTPRSDSLLLGRLVPSPYSLQHFASQLAALQLRGLRRL